MKHCLCKVQALVLYGLDGHLPCEVPSVTLIIDTPVTDCDCETLYFFMRQPEVQALNPAPACLQAHALDYDPPYASGVAKSIQLMHNELAIAYSSQTTVNI